MGFGIRCLREYLGQGGLPSPLTKIIDFGYYDGPVSGVAWSEKCSLDLRFDLLASDAADNLRIYCLSTLPAGSFELLIRACATTEDGEPPEPWREWCPMWIFPTETVRAETERTVAAVRARATPPLFVIGTLYLPEGIISAREVTGELSEHIMNELEPGGGTSRSTAAQSQETGSPPDWFAFLGLDREAYLHIYDDENGEGNDPPG